MYFCSEREKKEYALHVRMCECPIAALTNWQIFTELCMNPILCRDFWFPKLSNLSMTDTQNFEVGATVQDA